MLGSVGVPEPEVKARQRPYELSGGLRQRALIASAIALDPRLLVADEPTTALDVTIQAQVLDLLAESKDRGPSIILISHDLSVVARLADEVIVMRGGEVEHGPAHQVLHQPRHEYTQALLDAIPSEHTRGARLVPPAQGESAELQTRRGAPASRSTAAVPCSKRGTSPRSSAGRTRSTGRSWTTCRSSCSRRDPRHRRRVGFGQDDERADRAGPAAADLRRGPAPRAAVVGCRRRRAGRCASGSASSTRTRWLLRPALGRRPDHYRRAPRGQPAAVVKDRGTGARHPPA